MDNRGQRDVAFGVESKKVLKTFDVDSFHIMKFINSKFKSVKRMYMFIMDFEKNEYEIVKVPFIR